MCNTCSDEDEYPVLTALQQPDAKHHGIPKLQRGNQWDRSSRLTPEKIAAIEDKIKKGHLTLPECGPGQIWSMGDSGSSIKVADHEKHFPGARLRESEASRKGVAYQNADGSPLPNRGEFDVDFTTDEGHKRRATFQNASVMMPIPSLGEIADNESDVVLSKHHGKIICTETGEVDHINKCFGVYFLRLNVAPELLQPPASTFGRPGAAP